MSPKLPTEVDEKEKDKMPKKAPKDATPGDDVEYGELSIVPLKADGSPEPVVGNAVLMAVWEATVFAKTYNISALTAKRAQLVEEIAKIDVILAGGE